MKLQIIPTIKQGLEVIIKNPTILAVILFYAFLQSVIIYFFVYAPETELEYFGLYILISSVISFFLSSIIIIMIYDVVKNNRVSLSEAINLLIRRFIFILIGCILYYIVVILGLIALIIPGIFFFIKFGFINYLILLDNERIINSFKKSWQITQGNWWRIFGLFLIFFIPAMILSGIASVIIVHAVQIALIFDFISLLLMGWGMSVFTIVYIHLTKKIETNLTI
jgi:hypothetical protein